MPYMQAMISQGKGAAEFILTRFFSRLIPLFILGFVAAYVQDAAAEPDVRSLCGSHLVAFFLLGHLHGISFSIRKRLSFSRFANNVKNLLPAGGVAFSSGCSISTMPWTIEGTAKNLQNPDLAKAVIPATTNIQQIGDCIANTFLCFLIYHQFNGAAPSLSYGCRLASFLFLPDLQPRLFWAELSLSCSRSMNPIWDSHPEMIAMILAFNVILDPVITCTNVVANGALCRVFERTWSLVSFKKELQSSSK